MNATEKLDAARQALEGTSVNVDEFLKKFAKLCGVENHPEAICDDDLCAARFEDIEKCGVPLIRARRIARIFRGEDDSKAAPTPIKIDISNDPEKHAATLTAVQLVDHFDPDNHISPYGLKLKEATNDRRCLVYNKDGSLNPELSKQLVDEIVNLEYPERDTVTVDGVPSQVYRVGERPDRFASENPAEPGTPLRPDGVSDAGCNWASLPLNVQQLVYLAVRTGEEDDKEIDIFDRVQGKDFAQVAKRYPKASVKFQEQDSLGTLPQLKIRLGGKKMGGGTNDPFKTGHRVW